MTSRFRVAATTPLLHSVVFDVERRVVVGGGSTFERDVVAHVGAVAVVAVDELDRVGVIRQYRAPFDRVTYEIPAGTLDHPGESALSAAKRELLEEMGCRASRWRRIGRFMVSPGWTNQVMTIYEARELVVGPRHPEGPEEEESRVAWLTPEEVTRLLAGPQAVDATLALGVLQVSRGPSR
ncbi:MAG: NUDIX hydrolase [Acidimicrobiales bacterium]